jgi:hypothetical protein
MNTTSKSRVRAKVALGRGLALGAALVLGGCDGLFDVENPANLLDVDLTDPKLEETLGNSAEGNLGPWLAYVFESGELLGDAMYFRGLTHWGTTVNLGYRDRPINIVEEPYLGLAASVWIADEMIGRLERIVTTPGSHLGIARSNFWGAVARMTLASYFRSVQLDSTGVHFTPAEAIESALDRFENAAQIAGAAGDLNLEAGAQGGVARAHRSLYYEPIALGEGSGDLSLFQQAETWARAALDTDPDYLVQVRFGAPGPSNQLSGSYSLSPKFADLIDPVSGEEDPRVRHEAPRMDPEGVFIRSLKYYPNQYTPIPVSRAAEAELIIAEARYLDDDLPGAVEFINRVRDRSNLPPFESGDAEEVWTQLLYEREVELLLEGRRWEDMRYYNILPWDWDQVNQLEGMAKRWPPAPKGAGSGTDPTTG